MLIRFFYMLRQGGVPVSITEFLALLEALQARVVDLSAEDFYFLSRVSSRTGDRTRFTYGAHTLTEPSFLALLRAYQQVFPMSADEVRFLPEVYRFFILNYVVREGARFFRPDLCTAFRRDAVRTYLPAFDRHDFSPLYDVA